jgi:hypothetical protein
MAVATFKAKNVFGIAYPVAGRNDAKIHVSPDRRCEPASTHVRASGRGAGSKPTFAGVTFADVLEFGPTKAHIRAMKSHSSITVIVAVLIIVVSMAFLFRWHVVSSSIGLQRIDRWTGHLQICNLANGKIICVDE